MFGVKYLFDSNLLLHTHYYKTVPIVILWSVLWIIAQM